MKINGKIKASVKIKSQKPKIDKQAIDKNKLQKMFQINKTLHIPSQKKIFQHKVTQLAK
jgi:hypothetical protein